MADAKTLYDEDFFLWSKQQADALRAAARTAANQLIDWENVAEEIESLGRSDRRELHSQIRRVIEHLLKLEYSVASDPRVGWIESITDARNQIDVVLEESPSLRSHVEEAIGAEFRRGARKIVTDLGKRGEISPAIVAAIWAKCYTEEDILGDWFPSDPQRAPHARRRRKMP